MKKVYLVLHDIRSAHNVGSLFRTADGMGVSKIFITGYTPAPVDRFNRKDVRIAKVSLGAEHSVPWEQGSVTEVLTALKNDGVSVVSLEQTPNATPLHQFQTDRSVVLVVGNEIEGVSKEVLDMSDTILEIPMKGKKESLNVSNAGAIALFHLTNSS